MDTGLDASSLLQQARDRSGLTQRALAKRAKTSQSVIARIESGQTSPSTETLARIVSAAGFDVAASLTPRVTVDPQMLDDVPRILRLTPEQRLIEVRNLSRFEHA